MTHRERWRSVRNKEELYISLAVFAGLIISVIGCFMVSVSVGIIGLGLGIVLACVLKIEWQVNSMSYKNKTLRRKHSPPHRYNRRRDGVTIVPADKERTKLEELRLRRQWAHRRCR